MTLHRKKSVLRSLGTALLLASGTLGAKCDGIDTQPFHMTQADCRPNTAQILVMDGMMKRLCGCLGESNNTIIRGGATLACTVNSGTRVFFHFSGAKQRHQIVPVGSPGFPASPPYTPDDDTNSLTHVVHLTGSGTYSFKDQFDSSLNGQIIVP